jgi:hypothetical protein
VPDNRSRVALVATLALFLRNVISPFLFFYKALLFFTLPIEVTIAAAVILLVEKSKLTTYIEDVETRRGVAKGTSLWQKILELFGRKR